jgi:hypothetical protein
MTLRHVIVWDIEIVHDLAAAVAYTGDGFDRPSVCLWSVWSDDFPVA